MSEDYMYRIRAKRTDSTTQTWEMDEEQPAKDLFESLKKDKAISGIVFDKKLIPSWQPIELFFRQESA